MISILVLTLNEELNLPRCLASISWCDDIVILDSLSADHTEEIAREAGARFIQRQFDNYSAHRNWSLKNIEYKYEWLLIVDADERVPADLREEVLATVANAPSEVAAYRIRYKNMFMGRWIKHSSFYPSYITRLIRPLRVYYEDRLVNAHPIVEGQVRDLKTHFVHYSFNKGFAEWFAKHNRYSDMEAVESMRQLQSNHINWKEVISSDPMLRRRALKNLSFRLPGRPIFKFLYMYFFRRGFLDGYPGFVYCMLQTIYEYMICLKVIEAQRRKKGLSL